MAVLTPQSPTNPTTTAMNFKIQRPDDSLPPPTIKVQQIDEQTWRINGRWINLNELTLDQMSNWLQELKTFLGYQATHTETAGELVDFLEQKLAESQERYINSLAKYRLLQQLQQKINTLLSEESN